YVSSATWSPRRSASGRLARVSTTYRPNTELRTGTLSMANTALVGDTGDASEMAQADPSRTVLEPRNGSTTYGPEPKPQTPSVMPRSLGILRAPCIEAMSMQPPRPAVVLNSTRPKVSTKSRPRPCSKLLMADQTSPRLPKMLWIQVRTGRGVTVS